MPHPDVVPPVVVDGPHLLDVAAEVTIPHERTVAETAIVTMIVETAVTVIALVVQMTGMITFYSPVQLYSNTSSGTVTLRKNVKRVVRMAPMAKIGKVTLNFPIASRWIKLADT